MPSALAIFAHPDDIEFVAAGTLLQLQARGWEIHYMNLSRGNCGSVQFDSETTAAKRLVYDSSDEAAESIADLLWDVALKLEDGGLSQTARELSQALQDLSNALKNPDASEAELWDAEHPQDVLNEGWAADDVYYPPGHLNSRPTPTSINCSSPRIAAGDNKASPRSVSRSSSECCRVVVAA